MYEQQIKRFLVKAEELRLSTDPELLEERQDLHRSISEALESSEALDQEELQRFLEIHDPKNAKEIREEVGLTYSSIAEFCEQEIGPKDVQMDQSNESNTALWEILGGIDVLGPTAPEQYGGMDKGYTFHLFLMEAISQYSGSFGLSYGAHSNLNVNQIVLNGTEEQKAHYLPKLISGEWVGALAMSEFDAGSDVMAMKTTATWDETEETWTLDGEKAWITNGQSARVVIVYAATYDDAGRKNLTAFLVDTDTEGFNVDRKEDKMGMRGSETCVLSFNNCKISPEKVLGEVHGGTQVLKSGLDYERLILTGGPIGLAQAAIDYTIQRTSERKQFGHPIIANQAVAHELAEMEMQLYALRSFTYDLALRADDPNDSINDYETAAALYLASQAAINITQRCITLCGGMGYTKELPLERLFRDAQLYEIGAGAHHIRKEIWARARYKAYREELKRTLGLTSSFDQSVKIDPEDLAAIAERNPALATLLENSGEENLVLMPDPTAKRKRTAENDPGQAPAAAPEPGGNAVG